MYLKVLRLIGLCCLLFHCAHCKRNSSTKHVKFLMTLSYMDQSPFRSLTRCLVSIRYGIFKHISAFGSNHICAGAIIGSKKILTAAHCVFSTKNPYAMDEFLVVVKTPVRTERNRQTIVSLVHKIIPHPSYDENSGQNDIAIVIIRKEISEDKNGEAIPLINEEPTGMDCTALGWGRLFTNGPMTLEPSFTDLILKTDCSNANATKVSDLSGNSSSTNETEPYCVYNLCFDFRLLDTNPNVTPAWIADSCLNDEGAPIICNNQLASIVSYPCSKHSDKPPLPAEFVNVYYFRDWIEANCARSAYTASSITLLTTLFVQRWQRIL